METQQILPGVESEVQVQKVRKRTRRTEFQMMVDRIGEMSLDRLAIFAAEMRSRYPRQAAMLASELASPASDRS
jgi:hypothetical protein